MRVILATGFIDAEPCDVVIDHKHRCFWRGREMRFLQCQRGLTYSHAWRVVTALLSAMPAIMSYNELFEAMWYDRDRPTDPKGVLKCTISRNHDLLFWLGVRVRSVRGRGYYLEPLRQ